MSIVRPIGFDMKNALSVEDIIFPLSGFSDSWARMIIADREAGLTPFVRIGVAVSVVEQVALTVQMARLYGWDMHTSAVY